MRAAIFAIGFLVGALVLGVLLLDPGEVVTLTSQGSNGTTYETQLWLVETGGGVYVRARSPGADWLERVRRHPEITLRREGEEARFRALVEPEAAVRHSVNRAMHAKYGLADWIFSHIADPDRAVPVRLEPLGLASESDAPTARHP